MYLYGASGHAKVVISVLKSIGIPVIGIFDDDLKIKKLLNYSVIGKYNPELLNEDQIIVTIGNNCIRARIVDLITTDFGIGIHKTASVSEYSSINIGTVVMQNSVIQSDVEIGKHVIINTSAIVEHDCKVEDFVHISPNVTLCGNVKIGTGTHIGAGAIIIPGINVGKWCVVGAGSVIIKDVPENSVIVGNPGRIIKMIK